MADDDDRRPHTRLVAVERSRTASGWEWHLVIGGERVVGPEGVGIFTDLHDKNATFPNMLRRLLVRASRTGPSR